MGMRSATLLEMVDEYDEVKAEALENGERIGIDSITIVRRGHVVAEFYLNPLFKPDTPHIIHSCTKSIVSMLIGIAIDEGKIASLQTPVLQFFPDVNIAKPDPRLQAMTVEDLLTMQTGLHTEDSFLFKWRGLFKMMKTDDWVRHALNLPMDVEPGTRFDYSNISTYLLSAILTQATGTDALSYAREKLFTPLGISEVRWEQSPSAIYIGWARMWLTPTDMAKLGLLSLQKGKWEDTQVVPAAWVEATTRPQSDPRAYRYFQNEDGSTDYTLSTGYWVYANIARPFSDGYGYQWWFDADGMYTALGHQGQYITVVPKLDLVVVFTGRLIGDSNLLPARLLKEFVIPAVESETALPEATTAVRD